MVPSVLSFPLTPMGTCSIPSPLPPSVSSASAPDFLPCDGRWRAGWLQTSLKNSPILLRLPCSLTTKVRSPRSPLCTDRDPTTA